MNNFNFGYEYILNTLKRYKNSYECENIEELASNIYNKFKMTGIDEEELFINKHDNFIRSFIVNKRYNIEYTNNLNDMIKSVSNLINTNMKGSKDVSKDIIDLSIILLSKNKTPMEVDKGIHNDYIRKYMMYKNIKLKSTITNLYPDVKAKPKRIKISNRAKALILASTIATMTVYYAAYSEADYNKTLDLVSTIDEYDYPTIPYEMANEFVDTTDNILNNYDNYSNYGSEFGQLCLFKAYESFSEDKYHGMDSMISLLKEQSKDDDRELFNDINKCSCYPEYVYNKLLNANVIDENNEYYNAVRSYDRQHANYKGTHPYSNLTKSEQKSLNKMMELYSKYCSSLSNKMFNTVDNVRKM